jgi:hypothetical protein
MELPIKHDFTYPSENEEHYPRLSVKANSGCQGQENSPSSIWNFPIRKIFV